MNIDYFALAAATAALTILWRTLKDDHPRFKEWVKHLPMVGNSLSCGVCVSFWFSLPGAFFLPPIAGFHGTISVFILWLSLGTGVLVLRSFAIVLLEGAAVLKHSHASSHEASTPQ